MKVTVKLKKKFEKVGFTQYDSPLLEKIYTEAKAHAGLECAVSWHTARQHTGQNFVLVKT